MTEISLKFFWAREGAMESCYKLYTWINNTLLMLLVQMFWKISQISDYFKQKSVEDYNSQGTFMFKPLTKESKLRRHIRSMSDVQSSTPYRIQFRSRKGLTHTLTYDSDTHTKMNSRRYQDSTDSSDCCDSKTYIQRNILKHTERIL